jgi:hypothetical protein
LTAILREAWSTSQQTEDRREKIQALSLAKDCYLMKLDLLTNATVVDDAIRFVSESKTSKDKEKEQVKGSLSSSSDSSGNEDNNKESKESDYDDDDDEKSNKEGEERQEHDTREITINQVF